MTTPVITPRTLEAGGLLLRPWEAADEPAVTAALRDPGVLRWAAGRGAAELPEADRGRAWLAPRLAGWSAGTAAFAVVDAATGTLAGSVGLRDVDRLPGQAVASYWTAPASRGRGVAATALDAAARWAFTPVGRGGLGLHRIILDHALVNTGSCAVAARAGFRLEGTMRDHFIDPGGRRHDSHLHARLATDPHPAGPARRV
ncbi:GNAT family N-acetyltransferase [Nocardiopsis trehalosi]|uniref:GNAT family N-acetyltransferase n=1 Tax=Nocardiopsis trehalosi TaxID=109329 RepID=UPI00082F0996|nr:GNAT family protein [Nocardiopsis trehalosi]